MPFLCLIFPEAIRFSRAASRLAFCLLDRERVNSSLDTDGFRVGQHLHDALLGGELGTHIDLLADQLVLLLIVRASFEVLIPILLQVLLVTSTQVSHQHARELPVLLDDIGRRRVLEQAEGRRQFGTQEHAVGPARIAAMLPVDPYFVGSHFDYHYRRQTHGALLQMAGIRRRVIGLCITAALVEPVHLLRSQRQGSTTHAWT